MIDFYYFADWPVDIPTAQPKLAGYGYIKDYPICSKCKIKFCVEVNLVEIKRRKKKAGE